MLGNYFLSQSLSLMWLMSYFYFKRWQKMFISTSSCLLNFSGVVYINYRRWQQLSNPWKHPCDESDWAVSKTQVIWYQVLTPCSSRRVKKTKWILIFLSSERWYLSFALMLHMEHHCDNFDIPFLFINLVTVLFNMHQLHSTYKNNQDCFMLNSKWIPLQVFWRIILYIYMPDTLHI